MESIMDFTMSARSMVKVPVVEISHISYGSKPATFADSTIRRVSASLPRRLAIAGQLARRLFCPCHQIDK